MSEQRLVLARRVSRRNVLAASISLAGLTVLGGCDAVQLDKNGFSLPTVGNTDAASMPGRLAYARGNELYLWSGGSTRRLAAGQAIVDPAWSPDGSRLAAVALGTNHSELVVLDANGRNPRQLTRDFSDVSVADSVWARKPSWSPDGTRVAYVSDRGQNDMSLWLIGANGGQPEPAILEAPYSAGLDWPSWAPNGRDIAFTTFASGVAQIRSYDTSSRQTRNLVDDAEGSFDPAWSPHGRRLAFVARAGGNDDVYVLDLAGGTRQRLTAGGLNRAPTWSPRGDAVAFVGAVDGGFDLFVIATDQGGRGAASEPFRLTRGAGIVAQAGVSWTS